MKLFCWKGVDSLQQTTLSAYIYEVFKDSYSSIRFTIRRSIL